MEIELITYQLTLTNNIIESRVSDYFVNATQLCNISGKRFNDWYTLDSTKKLIKTLENYLRIEQKSKTDISVLQKSIKIQNTSINQEVEIKVIDIKKGNSIKYKAGSWIHPDLVVPFATWACPEISIKVSRWIQELVTTGSVSIDSKKTSQELIELTKQFQFEIKEKDNQLKIKDNLLLDANFKNLKLDNKILNVKQYKEDGFVYLVTNDSWQYNNMYRLGRTGNVAKRINDYKLGRSLDEKLYYVYFFKTKDVQTLEYILRSNLAKFREDPKSDQYILHSSILMPLVDEICNNFNKKNMKWINDAILDNIEIAKEPIILEKLKLSKDDRNNYIDIENISSNYDEMIEEYNNIRELSDSENDNVDNTTLILEYKEEKLSSDEEIDNLPNEFLRLKAKKRNKFISQMNNVNLKVISSYKTIEHNISLMCIKNHTFDIIPNNHDLEKVICHVCDNIIKTMEATKLVKSRGMQCLNYLEKQFKCSNGHVFITCNLNYTLHRNGGCTTCNKRTRLNKQDYHDLANSNGGKWIETEKVPSSHFPTTWICKKNHTFESKYQPAYINWNNQCLECKVTNTTQNYINRVNDIIYIYPSAKLLTTKILAYDDKIKLSCSHIPNGWELILRGFLLKKCWKCSKCKKEQIPKSIINSSEEIIDNVPCSSKDSCKEIYRKSQAEESEIEQEIIKVEKSSNIYYDAVMEMINKYNAKLLTPKENINKGMDPISIQCTHKSWNTHVRSMIKMVWNCSTCKKSIKIN